MSWEVKDGIGYSINNSPRWFNPVIQDSIEYNKDIYCGKHYSIISDFVDKDKYTEIENIILFGDTKE